MENYSLYRSWTIDEAHSVGKKFKAICKSSHSYEHYLTIGKEYEIEITKNILPVSPLCKGTGDNGVGFECHLERFTKI